MKSILFVLAIYTSLIAQAQPLKILIITGGHGFERETFFSMFDSYEDVQWQEVKHPNANKFYESNLAENFDVFVFYDMNQQISAYEKNNFCELVAAGKPMVFLHHSLVSYQDWPEFEKIIGGKYHKEAELKGDTLIPASTYQHDVQIEIKLEMPTHPILSGLQNFSLQDEVYGGFTYLPDIKPLLSTNHPGSSRYIAWINECGNSKVVYIQPGHDHHAFNNENYRRLLYQAIKWSYKENKKPFN